MRSLLLAIPLLSLACDDDGPDRSDGAATVDDTSSSDGADESESDESNGGVDPEVCAAELNACLGDYAKYDSCLDADNECDPEWDPCRSYYDECDAKWSSCIDDYDECDPDGYLEYTLCIAGVETCYYNCCPYEQGTTNYVVYCITDGADDAVVACKQECDDGVDCLTPTP